MPIYAFEGHTPQVADDAFIAPTAVLIGNVRVESGASVWFNAVLRGDYAPIVVGEGANVQDGSVLHGPPGHELLIGRNATVGHLCVVHGATIGEEALIGNGATVLDGAKIGARAMVGGGAVVPPNFELPDDMLAVGVPAKIKGLIPGTPAEMWIQLNPGAYQDLARRYRMNLPVSG